jgi:predicted PurR-regulated permease PerM
MSLFGAVDVNQIIFLVMAVIALFVILIFASLFILRKKRPQIVALEAVTIHEFISLCISFLYFVIVVITLIVLIYQNKIISTQTNYALQSVEGSIYSNITTQSLAEDQIFVNSPELRPYFYEGKLLEQGDPLKHKVHATSEYLLDFFDSLESQLKKYPNLWIHEKREWEANIIDQFAWSPELCRYLDATKDWYSTELYALRVEGEKKRHQGYTGQILLREQH